MSKHLNVKNANIGFSSIETDSLPATYTNAQTLRESYAFNQHRGDNAMRSTVNYVRKYYKPSGACMLSYFFARLPFFHWITRYDVKENLVKDLAAGITVYYWNYKLLLIS